MNDTQRRNGELAEAFAKRHGVPRWYTDAAELVEDKEVDAVYIGMFPLRAPPLFSRPRTHASSFVFPPRSHHTILHYSDAPRDPPRFCAALLRQGQAVLGREAHGAVGG